MPNPRCLHATNCGGGEIRGKVYFEKPNKPGVVESLPACTECAKPLFAPRINRKLTDAVVLISTFGDAIPELAELGSVEVEQGEIRRVQGRLGRVVADFKQGRELTQVISAASTVLGQVQYRIAGRFLEAINRLYPKAYPNFRDRVRHQRNFAQQRYEEAASLNKQIEDFFSRRSMVPKDVRGGFLGAANEAFHNSLQVLAGLGKSFRKEKKAAQVDPRDAPLIEKVVGFDPTSLVSKPDEEQGGRGMPTLTEEQKEALSQLWRMASHYEMSATPAAVDPLASLPKRTRIVTGTKTKRARKRVMAVMEEHGGFPNLTPVLNLRKKKTFKLAGATGVDDPTTIAAAINGGDT